MCLNEYLIPFFFEWRDGIKQVENCCQVDHAWALLFQDWVCGNDFNHTFMSLHTQLKRWLSLMLIANEQLSPYPTILHVHARLKLYPFLTAANKMKTIVSIGLQVPF